MTQIEDSDDERENEKAEKKGEEEKSKKQNGEKEAPTEDVKMETGAYLNSIIIII